MSHVEFWRSWFGVHGGREVGLPYREYCSDARAFVEFLERCSKTHGPAFMSVQGYSARNVPSVFEKAFFDFDCNENPEKAIAEAKDFASQIERFYGAKAFPVSSGNRGAHVYVWVPVLEFLPAQTLLIKEAYRRLQEKLLKGLRYETLDRGVVGDLARLSRVPYTLHEKSGRLCEPLSPFEDLEAYREKPLPRQLLKATLLEAKTALEERSKPRSRAGRRVSGVRRQIQTLIEKARQGGKLEHRERLAIACEFLGLGWTDDQIVGLFSELVRGDDFDERKTRYYVENARKLGYKPFKRSTLEELMK
jgi:hypothetical protein